MTLSMRGVVGLVVGFGVAYLAGCASGPETEERDATEGALRAGASTSCEDDEECDESAAESSPRMTKDECEAHCKSVLAGAERLRHDDCEAHGTDRALPPGKVCSCVFSCKHAGDFSQSY